MNSHGMNEEELEMFKERAEAEFFSRLEKGEDIRVFLYFPYNLLSDKVKKYLDEFLLLEAYKGIEKDSEEFQKHFIVYEDTLIKINLEKADQRLDLLKRMIDYFVEKEAYENCVKVQDIIKKLQDNGQGKDSSNSSGAAS